MLAFARLAAGVELVLQVAEGLIGQALLVAQRLGEAFHGALAFGLAALALSLGDAHVLHHLLKLLQRLLRFGHAALLHQFLNAVHHALQVVLRHLHAVFGHLRVRVHRIAVLLRLPRQLAKVFIRRLAQLLHELRDLFVTGAVAHGLAQPFLRAPQPFQRVGQIALFQQHGEIPERLGDFVAHLAGQADLRLRLKPPEDDAQAQIGGFRPEQPLGPVRHGAQHLRHAGGVVAVPQKVTPLFGDRCGQRVEEAPRGQPHGIRRGLAHIPGGVRRGQRDRDGQVGPGVFREILDQGFLEDGAVARDRHGQRHRDIVARFGIEREAMPALDRGEVQRQERLAALNAVIVGGHERQGEFAHRTGLRRAGDAQFRRGVGQHGNRPRAPGGAFDAHLARLRDGEILHRVRGRGHLAHTAGHGFRQRERAHFAIEAQGDAAALRQRQGLGGHVRQIDGRQAGIARRLGPAFPCGADSGLRGAGCHVGHAAHAPDRPEDECNHEGQSRDIAQGIGVAVGDAQVGADGAGLRRAGGHARLMRTPDGGGCGVIRPDRLIVHQRLDRAARKARIKAGQRLDPAGPAEAARAPAGGDQRAQRGQHRAAPDNLDRQQIVQTHHQRRQRQHHDAEERPEGAQGTFGGHPGARDHQRQAQTGQDGVLSGAGAKGHCGLRGVCARDSVTAIREWYRD